MPMTMMIIQCLHWANHELTGGVKYWLTVLTIRKVLCGLTCKAHLPKTVCTNVPHSATAAISFRVNPQVSPTTQSGLPARTDTTDTIFARRRAAGGI